MDEAILDSIQTIALVGTLWMTGIGLGMKVRMGDVLSSLTRGRLVARTITLDIILVPIAMWLAVRLLVADEGYATGLLLVAFAAAGPLGIKLAHVTGADTAYAIGIVVVLEIANILVIPTWSSVLGVTASVDVMLDIVRTVALLVVLPIVAGMGVRRLRGPSSELLADGALRLATVGLVAVVGIVMYRSIDVMAASLTNGAALASLITIGFALAAGWLMGGPGRETRLTTSVVTGCRANGAALAVAVSAFAADPAVAAGVVTAGLISITLPTALAYLIARRSMAADPRTVQAAR